MSILYSSPGLYHGLMKLLYGRFFEERYRAISNLIPEGAQVTDVCAGDCYLYRNFLFEKGVDYLALDISPVFVRHAQASGIQAEQFDLWEDNIPRSEYIVLQASLYQFLPDVRFIVEKLIRSASELVIITEPIRNISKSRNPFMAHVARWITTPHRLSDHEYTGDRFDLGSIQALFHSCGAFEEDYILPGQREILAVFHGYLET